MNKNLNQNKDIDKNNSSEDELFLSRIFFDTWERLVFKFFQTKKEFDRDYLKQIIKKNLANIKDIWSSFTVERSNLKSFKFNTPEYSLAYFIGFHVSNSARIYQTLNRLLDRYTVDLSSIKTQSINIFDIGCGTGAMSSALVDFIISHLIKNIDSIPGISINLYLLDRSSFFIKQAHMFLETLFEKYKDLYKIDPSKISFSIKDYKSSIENLGSSKIFQSFDQDSLNIFLIGYLYNEIVSKKKAGSSFHTLFQKKYIKNSKSLTIILDSANKTPCRNLMMFKDFIIEENSYTPIYPCPLLKNRCPMLNKSDWCYSEFSFKKDIFQNFIDNSLKIDRSSLSVSTLCFISDTLLPHIKPKYSTSSPIVVGKPIIKADKTQKHIQYLLCDGKKLFKKDPTNKNNILYLKGEEYKKELKK